MMALRAVLRRLRRNALALTLILTALALGACIWAILEVQAQRTAVALAACLNQDARHKATVDELNRQIDSRVRLVARGRRKELEDSRQFTILLIDDLAPYRDCQTVARKVTK